MPATHAAASTTPAATRSECPSVRDPSPARMSNALPNPPNPLVASAGIPVEDEDEEDEEAEEESDKADEAEDAGLAGSTPAPVGIAVAVPELIEIWI